MLIPLPTINVTMSLDDDNHASSHSTKMKVRRSMDIEFHDHLFDDLLDELHDLDTDNEEIQNSTNIAGERDDDSFGEASDSCQPDHEFLDQILEEYHPERINLLDPTVPESVYNKKPRGSTASISASSNTIPKKGNAESFQSVAQVTSLSLKSNALPNDDAKSVDAVATKSKEKVDGDPNAKNEEETDDSFIKSPHNRTQRATDRTKLLGSMGEETKKSLRTINGTFWSKPFKGLSPSISGDAAGVADA